MSMRNMLRSNRVQRRQVARLLAGISLFVGVAVSVLPTQSALAAPFVTNGTDQAFGGTVQFEIGGLLPGNLSSNHDQINDTATILLAGTPTLQVIRFNSFDPVPGNTFTLMTWQTGLTGTFSTLSIDPLWLALPGRGYQLQYNNVGGPGNLQLIVLDTRAAIGLSAAVNDTVIRGGTGTLGLTVDNTAAPTNSNLVYTVTPSALTGTSYGSVSPAPAPLAPTAAAVAHTVAATTSTSTPLGINNVTFTVADPNASNTPQTQISTLTVLDYADPDIVNVSAPMTAMVTNIPDIGESVFYGGDSLTIDFGNVFQSSMQSASFDVTNTQNGQTAGLDLDTITGLDAFLSGPATFTNLAAASSQSYNVTLDTSTLGPVTKTYVFGSSDLNIPGATNKSFSVTVLGNIVPVPEPASFVLMLAGSALIAGHRRSKK